MAIRHQFPLSHVRTFECGDPTTIAVANAHGARIIGKDVIIFNKTPKPVISVRGVRPSSWVIRHERGGFNG